jgi:hypothetical protein
MQSLKHYFVADEYLTIWKHSGNTSINFNNFNMVNFAYVTIGNAFFLPSILFFKKFYPKVELLLKWGNWILMPSQKCKN